MVDHGKIYLSDHLLSVCQRLGISVQPARPLTPFDKAAVERFFRTLSEGLLTALPGYKGPDVYSRGKDPEGCAYFFTSELEQVIQEWIDRIYHRRPQAGLADPQVPGLELSPAEMLAQGTARAGRLKIPSHPGMMFDFLPVAWRTALRRGWRAALQRPGADPLPEPGQPVHRRPRRENGPSATTPTTSTGSISRIRPMTPGTSWRGSTPRRWACRSQPRRWHTLAAWSWRGNRHVDERQALAEPLGRWDAGLVRHPAERWMAVRASQQRAARLAAADQEPLAEAAVLPTVAGLADAHQAAPNSLPPGGDDDSPAELDTDAGDEDFYADAFEVLP